jgi:hypothetical protein
MKYEEKSCQASQVSDMVVDALVCALLTLSPVFVRIGFIVVTGSNAGPTDTIR